MLTITIPFEYYAKHQWLDAPDKYKHLRDLHEHLFKCSATLEVNKKDRELSFEEVRDFLNAHICPCFDRQSTTSSCEMMASLILDRIRKEYPNRRLSVMVSEDGGPYATASQMV